MAANKDIIDAVTEQINELKADPRKQSRIHKILKELSGLAQSLAGNSPEVDKLFTDAIKVITDIQAGKITDIGFGAVLGDLDTAKKLIEITTTKKNRQILSSVSTQIESLLNYRPDVQSVLNDLDALRALKGGPADATAFHDFHVLQIAFKSVWKHAFNKDLQVLVEQVFLEHTKLYQDAGLSLPPYDAINDIEQLTAFLDGLKIPIDPHVTYSTTTTTTTDETNTITQRTFDNNSTFTSPATLDISKFPLVTKIFPGAGWVWSQLSLVQQYNLNTEAYWIDQLQGLNDVTKKAEIDLHLRIGQIMLQNPDGPGGRIVKLVYKIGLALSEPYAFDVFAKHSYNFGLMLTYRQKWEPLEYQAGDLISTIPLAPGETRKYSKKLNIKRTRAEKEIERSMSSSSYQSSETSRAEAEIMKKASTATNFKQTASGSFNIGIGSINASTEFAANQGQESAANKKEFHEATIKAAQEYRLERSLEVNTSVSSETEEMNSGEISNPNTEITVTYLFYELQRRYNITELLYRVRPVILVALDVPAPHAIDEAWLVQYQWILARVLLDDSLRPALNYLSSGFAGDEVSIDIIKTHWMAQRRLIQSLENQVNDQLSMRNSLRETLVKTAEAKSLAEISELPLAAKILTLGLAPDPGSIDAEKSEAYRRSAESRLQYVEQSLADAQGKLKQGTDSFEQATKNYAAALQNQFSRHVAIDQLRIHVKQNIIYYMQAIWSHSVADQTFFELYKLDIDCPTPGAPQLNIISDPTLKMFGIYSLQVPHPSSNWDKRDLVELADIDNPLGFKGNYIIFPMKEGCYLTDFMLKDFIDGFTHNLKDPDSIAGFLESFDQLWAQTITTQADGTLDNSGSALFEGVEYDQDDLKKKLADYVVTARRTTEEIIVPTGQLFIEALPGTHPLLEDFKLLHRVEDVRKVKAEVRHAELENLRLAARLLENQSDQTKDNLLEDPDIEKKIIVEGLL
ncbi:MAG: hypothetical protein ABIR30_05120 [Chitinophagaceae bacterium]